MEAANRRNLVFFVGAGVSRLMGHDSWESFSRTLLQKANKKGKINFVELQQISKIADNKMRVSVAFSLFDQEELYSEISDIFQYRDEDTPGHRIIRSITELGVPIVTTNYDHNIESINPYYISYRSPKECSKTWSSNQPSVTHIHGSIELRGSIVATAADYIRHYNDESTKELLDLIFSEDNVVVFVGYGLAELELLEFILKKTSHENRYFSIHGILTTESKYNEVLENYFKELNIKLVKFNLDEKGYDELETTVHYWTDIIKNETLNPNHIHSEIRRIISELPDTENVARLIHTIRLSDEHIKFFFDAIHDSDHETEWIECILEEDFMRPVELIGSDQKPFSTVAINCIRSNSTKSIKIQSHLNKLTNFYNEHGSEVQTIDQIMIDVTISQVVSNPQFIDNWEDSLKRCLYHSEFNSYLCLNYINECQSFKELDSHYQIGILSIIIARVVNKKDQYEDGELLEKIIDAESDEVLVGLFSAIEIALTTLIQRYSYYDLTTVDNYQTESLDGVILITYCKIIRIVDGGTLYQFVSRTIREKNPLCTMALHAISVRYSELKSIFWKLKKYDSFSIPELRDFIINNRGSFKKKDKNKLARNIIYTKFSNNPELNKQHRFELLKLFVDTHTLSRYENQDSIMDPGKSDTLIHTMIREKSEIGNMDSFISAVNSESEPLSLCNIQKFIENNPGPVADNIEAFESSPIEIKRIIMENVEFDSSNTKIKEFILSTIVQSMEEEKDYNRILMSTIRKKIDENESLRSEIISILNEYVFNKLELFDNTYTTQNLKIDCLNNWYLSVIECILVLLRDDGYQSLKLLFDCISKCRNDEASTAIRASLALQWNWIYHLNQEWCEDNISKIFRKEQIEVASIYISYSTNYNAHAIGYLIDEELFLKINQYGDDNSLIKESKRNVGMMVGFYLYANGYRLNPKVNAVLKTADTSCVIGLIFGFRINIKHHAGNTESVDSVLEMAITDKQFDQGVAFEFLRLISLETSCVRKTLFEQLASTITFVSNDLKKYLDETIGADPTHVLNIIEILAKNAKFLKNSIFLEHLARLVSFDKARVIKICNILVSREFLEYTKILDMC